MNIDKYFRCYATIDLDAIVHNVEVMKEKLNKDTQIIAVIKTDGYGHGAVPVAKAVDSLCYGFAIASYSEGHNLRRHGISKPIFILGYIPPHDYEHAINEDMIPPVFTMKAAKEISKCATKLGKVAHISVAVDTGMGRIGYTVSDKSANEIAQISKLPNIKIESIFTHFAKADYADKTSAYGQLKKFNNFIDNLKALGVEANFYHCANSAAMMEMPEASLDLSRIGISMYGLYPSEEMDKENIKLTPVMSIYSHIVYVKDIEPGTGVSYGHTFVADKPMTIATIPLGYGDGYPRNLSNKGYVLINGKKAKILGRVCMDQFMVDVTDIEAKEGDLVTIVGKDGYEEILIDELALMADSFNYEFVCSVGKRVPRVYLKNGEIVATKDYYDDDYDINF